MNSRVDRAVNSPAADIFHVPRLTGTSRRRQLSELEGNDFDLVIIGGGITGAGIARQATLCGLSVALVEAQDFAAGTSSRSSKLIHGGLRYLAMGDVALVRETALERKAVHRLAPHLADPSWMVVPARSRASLLKFRAGIATYEKLGAVERTDRHCNWNRQALAQEEPLLDNSRYPWAVAYREYLTDDARLVLAVLRAAVSQGAVVANYLKVEEISLTNSRVDGVIARCELGRERVRIRGRAVVNAAGPWVEELLLIKRDDRRLHLSKGVHIAVPHDRFPLNNLIVLSTSDKRSIFAIPRGDVTYVGTTDTSFTAGPTLWPQVLPQDVDYLLAPLPRYFDMPGLTAADVVSAWAGLRPLVNQPGKAAREISRKDEVWVGDSGLVSIAGGKLTGFRKMAEDALQALAPRFTEVLPCDDPLAPLPGGDHAGIAQTTEVLMQQFGLDHTNAQRLVRLYGSEASRVLQLDATVLTPAGRFFKGEIRWAVEVEAACCLEDVIYRRLRMAWFQPLEVASTLAPVAQEMARLLGWDGERTATEISETRARLALDLGFRNSSDGNNCDHKAQ